MTDAALAPLPPWLIMAGLLGVINAAACFMLIGQRLARLAWYVAAGAVVAGLGQALSAALQAPAPLKIGDVNVAAVSACVWGVLLVGRGLGLVRTHSASATAPGAASRRPVF